MMNCQMQHTWVLPHDFQVQDHACDSQVTITTHLGFLILCIALILLFFQLSKSSSHIWVSRNPIQHLCLVGLCEKGERWSPGMKSNLDSNLLGRTQDFSGKYSFSCPFQSRDSQRRPRRLKCCVLVWTTTLCHDQYSRLLNKPGIVGLPSSL